MTQSQKTSPNAGMVRTRIAPSPTGEDLHIGNLYTAYINWAFAHKNDGKFIVRIEDTDRTRLVEGSEEKILQTLKDFGVTYDEGVDAGGEYAPYRQSERLPLYQKHAEELVASGKAYYCFCTEERLSELRDQQKAAKQVSKYDKKCLALKTEEALQRVKDGEKYVIRLNVPHAETITFTDVVRGEISFATNDIDDQVLMKSDGFPTYHLAVVIDDHVMKISHVIRAEEWISSTPKHVLLYRAFGWPLPIYVHVPILRNPDRSKLSKRKNPVWASWYLEQGYFPEAMLNYLSLMGWSHPEGKEIFSQEEFIKTFALEDIKATGPVFDLTKLEWMNGEYIRAMEPDELTKRLCVFNKKFLDKMYSEELIRSAVPLVQERIKTLKEFDDYCRFFVEAPEAVEVDTTHTSVANETLDKIQNSDWKADHIGEVLQEAAKLHTIPFGAFFMTLRLAMTGKKVTPPLNESLEILGKEESLNRLKQVS